VRLNHLADQEQSCLQDLYDVAANAMSPLLSFADEGTSLPDHVHFNGPVAIENWTGFEKQAMQAVVFGPGGTTLAQTSGNR
jgi:hypothetical protein